MNFFGYDPDVDGDLDLKPWVERPFTSFNMKPLETCSQERSPGTFKYSLCSDCYKCTGFPKRLS